MTIEMHVSACAIKELCSACDAVTAKIHCMYFHGYCSLVTNPASPSNWNTQLLLQVVHCRYVVWEMLIGVGTSDRGHVTMSVHELGPTFDYALASLLHPFRYMCTNVMIHFLLQFVLIMTYTFNKEKERLFIAIPRVNATLPVNIVTIKFLIDLLKSWYNHR